ncbi:MAG: T9SS type A sorting domain-containing protein [Bacteroidota bacterium]
MKRIYYISFCLIFISVSKLSAQEVSSFAYQSESGCIEYVTDEANNYIPDFSYAGYGGGGIPLPEVPMVIQLNPISGDNTSHIQAAIDSLAKRPLDENGLRGAVELNAGSYEIHGQLFVNQNGIVLRGVGDDIDSTQNTILKGIGNTPSQRDLIVVGDFTIWDWKDRVPNSTVNITNPFVPSGSRSLTLASVTNLNIGEEIIVFQPSTEAWLASINYGDTASDEPWSPSQIDLYYQRRIEAVVAAENKIILDAPIYDHLDNSLAQSVIYKLAEPNIRTNIGVENLRIEIETEGPETENHVKNGILLKGVRNVWVQEVTVLHFMYAAIYTRAARNVTVRNCRGLEPHSKITGARRYNFDTDAYSNNILFEKCHASYGRHSFVSNGASTASGIVFYDCTTEHDYNASEGHRRWSQGLLFDNITFTEPETTNLLGLYNRGDYGTGHGWSSVNSVAWNVNLNSSLKKILIQQPPGRQNYAVGCLANVTNFHRFNHPIGAVELSRKEVIPSSLYEAQLTDRLTSGSKPDAPAKLEVDYDEFTQSYQLEWLDIAADETGYKVQVSVTQDGQFMDIENLAANTTSFSYSLPDSIFNTLTFRVAAFKGSCLSAFSNPVTVEQTVSSVDIVGAAEITIHPNPAGSFLHLHSKVPLDVIEVYDLKGSKINSFLGNKNIVNIHSLSMGLYYLKVRDISGKIEILEFIKY